MSYLLPVTCCTTNIGQFSDDLTIYSGKHEITIGTNDQIQSYTNGFAPNYNGIYIFNSASDFLNGLPAAAMHTRYSALPDGSFPYAKIKAGILVCMHRINSTLLITLS